LQPQRAVKIKSCGCRLPALLEFCGLRLIATVAAILQFLWLWADVLLLIFLPGPRVSETASVQSPCGHVPIR
jgi:hypothetical protein